MRSFHSFEETGKIKDSVIGDTEGVDVVLWSFPLKEKILINK